MKQKRIVKEQLDREMREKLRSEDQETVQEAEEYFKNQSEQHEVEEIELKMPGFIPHADRQNYIVWGRPGYGKSILA